jgi:two-component system, LuxR family, response regulator FixJ
VTRRRFARQRPNHLSLKISITRFLLSAVGSGDRSTGIDVDRIDEIRARKYRILVIDDDNDFRKSFCFKLRRKYKAEVEDVASGEAGVAKLKGGDSYDFIFTDIMMPGMTGIQTYRELRKLDGTIRIVMMSAYSDSEEWKKAQELGVPLLHKPIPEDQLINILVV